MKGHPFLFRCFAGVLYGLLAAIPGIEISSLAPAPWSVWIAPSGVATGLILGFVAAPILVEKPLRWFMDRVHGIPAASLAAGLFGLTVGLFLAFLLATPLGMLPGSLGHYAPLAASLILGALGVGTFVAWEKELVYAGRRVFPSAAVSLAGGETTAHPILVDTSAIIDGRIAEVTQSGFLQGTLVIPRFVLEELRHIADSSDAQRRNRGRRGLEMLNKLQRESIIPVEVMDWETNGAEDVDDKLLTVAARLQAPIVTTDFNLNRVAELQGIRVLNVNELSNALRPPVLPGEDLGVHIQQEGKEPNQGLAFLEDGTMIVVEGGRRFIGRDLEVVITRVLQTAAGRIIFSHPKDA